MSFWSTLGKRVTAEGNRVWHRLGWIFTGRRLTLLGGVLLMALLLGRTLGFGSWLSVGMSRPNPLAESEIQVGSTRLRVEVARTPAEIEQGLSDRTEIGSDGMLFLFPQPRRATFWMLRMQFPLDMIWFSQGKIAQINADVPPPVETDGIPTVVPTEQKMDSILEVPAGTAARYGWKIGDELQVLDSEF